MKVSSLVLLAGLGLPPCIGGAADATRSVDYAERNGGFAPAPSITPETKTPQIDRTVQDRRVNPTVIDKSSSEMGERRAPVKLGEAREKIIQDKTSHRPETRD